MNTLFLFFCIYLTHCSANHFTSEGKCNGKIIGFQKEQMSNWRGTVYWNFYTLIHLDLDIYTSMLSPRYDKNYIFYHHPICALYTGYTYTWNDPQPNYELKNSDVIVKWNACCVSNDELFDNFGKTIDKPLHDVCTSIVNTNSQSLIMLPNIQTKIIKLLTNHRNKTFAIVSIPYNITVNNNNFKQPKCSFNVESNKYKIGSKVKIYVDWQELGLFLNKYKDNIAEHVCRLIKTSNNEINFIDNTSQNTTNTEPNRLTLEKINNIMDY